MRFKKILSKAAKKIVSCVNGMVPKNKKRVIFITNPDFTGNGMAFYDFLHDNHKDYELIWFLKNMDETDHVQGVTYVRQNSLQAFWIYLRSKYIITTHNEMIGIKSANQVYLSLWHGMPLKKIGYLADSEASNMEAYSAERIATSELMRAIIASSFKEDASKVHVMGQPRNDYLFNKVNILDSIPENYKKILYMPTFRQNTNNSNFSDGKGIENNNFFRVKDFDLLALNAFLEQNKCVMYLKFHPFEERLLPDNLESQYIKVITSTYCKSRKIDINSILAEIDLLITDYSSVYFDYLILNRPMIFLTPDIQEYSLQRGGYTLEPVEYWMPGKHVTLQSEVLQEIEKLFKSEDEFSIKRQEINSLINRYSDANNCQRLYDKFFDGKINV